MSIVSQQAGPILCWRCGYELSGALASQACPECGTPAAESLDPDPRISRLVGLAARRCAAAMLMGAAWPFVIIFFVAPFVHSPRGTSQLYMIELAGVLLWTAMGVSACFMMTGPLLRMGRARFAAQSWRIIAGLGLLYTCLFSFLLWMVSSPTAGQERLFEIGHIPLNLWWVLWCIPAAWVIPALRAAPAKVLRLPVLVGISLAPFVTALVMQFTNRAGGRWIPWFGQMAFAASAIGLIVGLPLALLLLKPRAFPRKPQPQGQSNAAQ